MTKTITIPALPCASVKETLDFYVAMGFEITYQQEKPNTYGCVQYDDIQLHFFSMKGYEPANSYSTCLVIIPDADALNAVFKSGIKQAYGKVPVTGIPRITRPNNNNADGDRRFIVVDPGGNYIRFNQQQSEKPEDNQKPVTKLSRTLRAANLLVDSKGDFQAAATMLDKVLADENADEPEIYLQILVLRAEIALHLENPVFAKDLLEKINDVELNEVQQTQLSDTYQRAQEITAMLD